MIPVDSSVLYRLGQAIQPLRDISTDAKLTSDTTNGDVFFGAASAKAELETFISNNAYKAVIRVMAEPAKRLIKILDRVEEKTWGDEAGETLGIIDGQRLRAARCLPIFDT